MGIKKEAIPNHLLIRRFEKYAPVLPDQFKTRISELENADDHSKLWSVFQEKKNEIKARRRKRAKPIRKRPINSFTLLSLKIPNLFWFDFTLIFFFKLFFLFIL
jgi:hypothetical protein